MLLRRLLRRDDATPNHADAMSRGQTAETTTSARDAGSGASSTSVGEARPSPAPLGPPLAHPADFPVDALGPVGQPAAKAIQEITQAPGTICAHGTLFAMAAAVHARANVRMPYGASVPLSQYVIDIGESSERKTTIISHLTNFLQRHEESLEIEYQQKLSEWHQSKSDDQGPPPLKPGLIVHEPTYEGLLKTLDEGPGCAVLLNDDAADFISGHAMNADNRLKTAAGLSRLWSGDSIVRPRASGDVTVRRKRFSMYLMVQGKAAEKLLGDELLQDQGFLSRIPVTWPESTIGTRMFRLPGDTARQTITRFNESLLGILRQPVSYRDASRNDLDLPDIELSDGAQREWAAFHDETERACGEGGVYEAIRAFAGKSPENVARIAAILTLVEDPSASQVTTSAMKRAVRIGQFHLSEKARLAAQANVNRETENARLLLSWLQEKWSERYISRTDIQQFGPNKLRNAKTAITEAIDLLVSKGWLHPIPEGATIRGRKRREAWEIVDPPI